MAKHYSLYHDRRFDKAYLMHRHDIDSFMKVGNIECLNCGRSCIALFSKDYAESVVEDAKRKDRHHLVRGVCRFCGSIIAEKEYTNPNFFADEMAGT